MCLHQMRGIYRESRTQCKFHVCHARARVCVCFSMIIILNYHHLLRLSWVVCFGTCVMPGATLPPCDLAAGPGDGDSSLWPGRRGLIGRRHSCCLSEPQPGRVRVLLSGKHTRFENDKSVRVYPVN